MRLGHAAILHMQAYYTCAGFVKRKMRRERTPGSWQRTQRFRLARDVQAGERWTMKKRGSSLRWNPMVLSIRGLLYQQGRTFAAFGPFGPRPGSNSTF